MINLEDTLKQIDNKTLTIFLDNYLNKDVITIIYDYYLDDLLSIDSHSTIYSGYITQLFDYDTCICGPYHDHFAEYEPSSPSHSINISILNFSKTNIDYTCKICNMNNNNEIGISSNMCKCIYHKKCISPFLQKNIDYCPVCSNLCIRCIFCVH